MRTLLAFFLALATVAGGVLLTGSLPVLESPAPTPTAAPVASTPATSYVTFSGRVLDAAGAPLEWAAVTVDGVTALTGVDGHFELSSVLTGALATIEANGFRSSTAPAQELPAEITLQAGDEAPLTVRLGTPADILVFDAVSFGRVASADRDRVLPGAGGYSIRLEMPAGQYVVVASAGGVPAAQTVSLPRRGAVLDLAFESAAEGGVPTVASGMVVSAAGRSIDAASHLAWVVAESPGGSRALVPLSAGGSFDQNVVTGSTLQAFAYDAAAGTIASSASIAAARDLRLTIGTRSRLPFAVEVASETAAADTCGFEGVKVMAGRVEPLLEREALLRGVPTLTGDLGIAETTLGDATLVTMFDAHSGHVLARAWSGDGYAPAAFDRLFDVGLREAAATRRPVGGRLVIRTDPLGQRFLSVVDVKTASGFAPPDGTLIELTADAGALRGAPFVRLPLAGGRTAEVPWVPPVGDVAPGTEVTFSARHSCGGTLALRTLTQPMPGKMSFNASFAAPTSSASCASGVAFDALLTIEFTRDEDGGIAVDIPITNGPRLLGSYDAATGAIAARGDADGVSWRIDGTITGSQIAGTLSVTVTGSDCNRTDKYAFSGVAA